MRFPHKTSALLASVCFPLASFCDWTIIDDFEDSDLSSYTFATSSVSGQQIFMTLADPTDIDNMGMWIESGDVGTTTNWSDTIAFKALPTALDNGMVGTLYFRFFKYDDGKTNNLHVILSQETTPVPGGWGLMSMIMKPLNENNEVSAHSSSYLIADVDPVTPGGWYQYWCVVDYDSATWELYMQAPGDSAPQQVRLDNGDGSFTTTFNLRVTPTGPMGTLQFATNTNTNGSTTGGAFIVDDVYWDTTRNLTNPVTGAGDEYWGGYLVGTDGTSKWIVTGTWMGTLDISYDPWLYSYKLKHWIWMPEPAADAPGAWVYVRK